MKTKARITEDAFCLAMAQFVPISHWCDVIEAYRALMNDPAEWIKRGQVPPPNLNEP
jgi:hypothetical protein